MYVHCFLFLFYNHTDTPSKLAVACAATKANHGCSTFCGYEAVYAGNDWICMPGAPRQELPFAMDTADVNEFCQLVAANSGCSDTCGFKWDTASGQCSLTASVIKESSHLRGRSEDEPIIGGSGKFRYQVTLHEIFTLGKICRF